MGILVLSFYLDIHSQNRYPFKMQIYKKNKQAKTRKEEEKSYAS